MEGDGATPTGTFPIRYGFYRHDRLKKPFTAIPMQPISEQLGWCDEPNHPCYNQRVTLPFTASHERLLRSHSHYDLIVVIGYNDAPVVPGKGSAIFIHIANENYEPTAGCIAFSKTDLIAILKDMTPQTRISLWQS